MNDTIATVCVYLVKLVRFMVLWVAIFITEKVYQDTYVSSVLVRDGTPPDLRPVVIYALLADFVFFAFTLMLISLLRAQNPSKTYAIDRNLITILVIDYVISVIVLSIIGLGVATVVQDREILRYRDDGLRSIRALGTLLLYAALIALVIPYFILA